jgi:hypothetical protein
MNTVHLRIFWVLYNAVKIDTERRNPITPTYGLELISVKRIL